MGAEISGSMAAGLAGGVSAGGSDASGLAGCGFGSAPTTGELFSAALALFFAFDSDVGGVGFFVATGPVVSDGSAAVAAEDCVLRSFETSGSFGDAVAGLCATATGTSLAGRNSRVAATIINRSRHVPTPTAMSMGTGTSDP